MYHVSFFGASKAEFVAGKKAHRIATLLRKRARFFEWSNHYRALYMYSLYSTFTLGKRNTIFRRVDFKDELTGGRRFRVCDLTPSSDSSSFLRICSLGHSELCPAQGQWYKNTVPPSLKIRANRICLRWFSTFVDICSLDFIVRSRFQLKKPKDIRLTTDGVADKTIARQPKIGN